MHRKIAVLASTLLAVPAFSYAESESDFLGELPVVLTASRLAQPLAEAPAAVTVIDRELMRASGARELADLLRLVPGFQVTNRDQDPARAVYHGLGGEFPMHMQVLIDGRSQYSPLYTGGVNWSLLPVAIDDIERIEVIRGSNSAAYGSNAFLGVVNIVTRHPAVTPGFTVEASSGNDVADQFVRLAHRGESYDLRATYQHLYDTGLASLFDDKDNKLFDLRADFALSPEDSLQINLGDITNHVGQGTGKTTNPYRNPMQDSRYVQAHWRRALAGGNETSLRASHTEDRQSGNRFTVSLAGGRDSAVASSDGIAVRDEMEWQNINNLSPTLRTVWGLGSYAERITQAGSFGPNNSPSRQVIRLFGNAEWRFADNWIGNLGSTWERDSAGATTMSPRLMVNHHLNANHTLRAGVSRAYRAASLFETRGNQRFVTANGVLYEYDYLAHDGVAPERITSRELGYLGNLPQYGLQIDTRLYAENIPNRILQVGAALPSNSCEYIELARPVVGWCGEADYSVNGQHFNTRGVEYQLRWRPQWEPLQNTQIVFNDALQRIDADTLNFVTVTQPQILANVVAQGRYSAPGRSNSLLVMQTLPGNVRLSAAWYHVGEMHWTVNSTAPKYTRFDWRLAYPFSIGATRAEAAFTVQSDGAPHTEYRSGQLVGRRGFATLRLEY